MKRYQDYKESGIDWIGEIPKDWEMTVLKRTAYLKGRIGWQGLTSEEYEREGEYALVTGTEFRDGRVDWNNCWFVEKERYQEDLYIQLQKDDLLITKDGTIGKIAHIDQLPKPATLNSGVFVLRPLKNSFVPRFMFWALRSDLFPQYIEYSKVGTTIAHLYQKTFERFVYPLPSQDEQERISVYLDKQCAIIDKVLKIKDNQLTVLEELRKSIIHKAMTRGLDDSVEFADSGDESLDKIPKHWKLDRIKDLSTKIGSGITPEGGATVYVDEGIPLLRSQNVHFDGLRMDDVAFITDQQHAEMLGTHVQVGDVLLNITGASIGRCYYITPEVCPANVNQHVCIIRPCYKLREKFLYYFLASSIGQGLILSCWRGASRQGLGSRELMSFVLPVPPAKEQNRIAEYLEEKNLEIRSVMINIEDQIETLEKYRASLIHECVTGKRLISDQDLKELANV